jgi:hypothetical protein
VISKYESLPPNSQSFKTPPNPQKEGEHAIAIFQKEEMRVTAFFHKETVSQLAIRPSTRSGRTANSLIFNVPQSAHGELVEP